MRAETESVHGDGLSVCLMCNGEMSISEHLNQSTMCGECARRDSEIFGYPNKAFYVLDDPTGTFTGGHFGKTDFLLSLEDKVWPSGTIVEQWNAYKYRCTFMVAGTTLLTMPEADPVGDGRWLLPDQQVSPALRNRGRKRTIFRSAGSTKYVRRAPRRRARPNG